MITFWTIVLTILIAPWVAAAGFFVGMMIIPPGPVLSVIICIVALFGTWVTVSNKLKEAYPGD